MRLHRDCMQSVSTVAMAVLTFVVGTYAAAQGPPVRDTLSAQARDSLIAAVLADTADLELDSLSRLPSAVAIRQTVTLRPTYRRYGVGGVDAAEQSSYASWSARFRRASIRIDMTPVSYVGDTSLTAGRPQVSFGGASPLSARLDLQLLRADTLRLFAQSASFPGTLAQIDAQALGAVGTSTIDLDAGALGIAARMGVRYARTQPIGDDGVALSFRGGVEYDPRPTGANAVSWRGTTVRGGVGINRTIADGTIGASMEVTKSFADSLGGRNLFPGGGSLLLDARVIRFIGEDGTGFISVLGFYSRPLGIQRPDQPTRLIPIGDFAGITTTGAFPLGALTLLPMASVMRESSSATAVFNRVVTGLNASGQTASLSLGLAVPLGRFVTVTPEVGGALGSVGQTVTSSFPRRFGRPLTSSQAFSDPIRGGWVAVEVTVAR